MIDQLRTIAIFQTVAELGSFRAAAKSLKLSPSVISHHITQLEGQLGTPLLYRSTRRMSLTDAGAELLAASQRMTLAAQEGLAAVNRRIEQPVGKLSITMNTSSATQPFCQFYTGFAKAYPKIQLSLHISDHSVQLEGSAFDLAIRGKADGLDDSSYKAQKIGDVKLGIFATPQYVATRPALKSFDDLADWDRIETFRIPWKSLASLLGAGMPQREPRIVMSCDNYEMGRQFMLADLGFLIEATALMIDHVKAGQVVQVLPSQSTRPFEIFAIYPANAPLDSPARLFIEYMTGPEMRKADWLSSGKHIVPV